MDDLKRHDESRNKIGAEALKSCGTAPKNIGIGAHSWKRAAIGEECLNAPTATDIEIDRITSSQKQDIFWNWAFTSSSITDIEAVTESGLQIMEEISDNNKENKIMPAALKIKEEI